MTISAKRRWRSSERIAVELLEQLGYRVIDIRKKIKISGIEVGEVDAIVEDEKGEKYAVEIKAGNIDVTGLRQAYVNALILGLKPLVIAKGFADDAAQALSGKLGIKVIELSNYFLIEPEELEIIIREVFSDILAESIKIFTIHEPLSPEEKSFLENIVKNPTLYDVASSMGKNINELVKKIRYLQNKGVLPKNVKNYKLLKYYASIALLSENLRYIIEALKTCISSSSSKE